MKIDKIYWYILSCLFILALDLLGLLNFLKRPADILIIPVKEEIFRSSNAVKNFSHMLFIYPQMTKLYEENLKFLKKQEEQDLKLRQLTLENNKLRTQLEAPFPSTYKFVPANVIAIPKYMEIDQGSDQGIKVGQVVVDGQILVGKVKEVTQQRSKIILASDPDFKIFAVTSRNTKGEVMGQGGGTILLSRVLQKEPLFLDDQVMTSGEDGIPGSLLVGKISYISADEAATYKQAKVVPVSDFAKEKIVFVITSL